MSDIPHSMSGLPGSATPTGHSHVFLGDAHEHAERRTWIVIWLCGAMMALEIIGGALFGSIALLAALAYSYARRHATGPRFTFGPGHLAAIVTPQSRDQDFYRARLARLRSLSHLTIEIQHAA